MRYQRPVRPILTVAPDKVEEFSAQRTDPAVIKEQKRIAALFRKNLVQRAPANESAEAAPPERS